MNEWPILASVRMALEQKASDYRRRIAGLRERLRHEGQDAVDPGHSAGANSLKLELECTEQVLKALPKPESVRILVTYEDCEAGSMAAVAIINAGYGGITLTVGGCRVQTMSCDAPISSDLLACKAGDETAIGKIVAVEDA